MKTINEFPDISTKRLAVKVRPKSERMIRKEHPWVFESAIVKVSEQGKAGDLAIIYDQKANKFLALGLFDPNSPIRIKLLQFKKGATIDKAWFRHKINLALQKRQELLKTETNSYRLVHGENDGLPDLVVDVYDKVAVIKLYSLIWMPYLKDLVDLIADISQTDCQVLRLSRKVQTHNEELLGLKDGMVLNGRLPSEEVVFMEHGLQFSANVIKGHKTGFFLDHRANRKKVGSMAKGKTVLDLFSYAGGFSVHALAGGAREVCSLDISQQAIDMAKKNASLNEDLISPDAQHTTITLDVFKGLQQLEKDKKQFDLVIVDPPSFAKQEREVEIALNTYKRLARMSAKLVRKRGTLLLASCSSRVVADVFFQAVEKAMTESEIAFQLTEKTFHDSDHPIGFPEGAYLKAAYYTIY